VSEIKPIELLAYLKETGSTQIAFAKRLSVNDRTVRRWLSGATPIPKWMKFVIK
jgi:DNA-binding transcriptional regulator YiaG